MLGQEKAELSQKRPLLMLCVKPKVNNHFFRMNVCYLNNVTYFFNVLMF